MRPTPQPGCELLCFLTQRGAPCGVGKNFDYVGKEMLALCRRLNIACAGRGFYALRHTHRTISDELRDQPAADLVMGHESPHMSRIYRERIDDARLRAVADHVPAWLWPKPPDDETAQDATTAEAAAAESRPEPQQQPFRLRLFAG